MNIVFDFDGTLHKTDKIYGYAVRKALREIDMDLPREKTDATDEQLSKYLGMNAEDMWQDFLPELNTMQRDKPIKSVGVYMEEGTSKGEAKLYENIPKLLSNLISQSHTLLILSNCSVSYMAAQRKAHDLDKWFTEYFCSESYNNEPKEIIFSEIMRKYPGKYIMVGDRRSDMQVSNNNDVITIGCMYGYGDENELSDADFKAFSVDEIADIILKNSSF